MEKFYTIQEAAEETAVTPHTLRYYERIGLLPKISRDKNGHRQYSELDLGWVTWLKHLRNSGMAIQEMKQFVTLTHAGADTIPARCDILTQHRQTLKQRIAELEAALARLDQKLDYYQQTEREMLLDGRASMTSVEQTS